MQVNGFVDSTKVVSATAKFTYTGSQVAWVTTLGLTRGSASVTASGYSPVTVTVHHATTVPADVAYVGLFPTNAKRSLVIKNLKNTTPRVDVDAFVYIGT